MLNMLFVERGAVAAPELLAALEETHAGLGHRKAQVDDDAAGAALAEPLRAAGYDVARHLYMALTGSRDREPAPGLAEEVDAATHAAVENAVTREEPHGSDEEVVQQLARARAAIRGAAPAGTRFFVGSADGVQAAHATLLAGDGIAQLEDVATLGAHRRRGLARAVCSLAVDAAAGAALTFVVADDGDWPKALYAKLGFAPAGAVWSFTKDPA
jgi:ribosomal protein S18 acetylase RimI-like enzyme